MTDYKASPPSETPDPPQNGYQAYLKPNRLSYFLVGMMFIFFAWYDLNKNNPKMDPLTKYGWPIIFIFSGLPPVIYGLTGKSWNFVKFINKHLKND